MNRRGFIAALAGVVAWVKTPRTLSPAASAIPPTCESAMDVAAQRDGSDLLDEVVAIDSDRALVRNVNFFQSGQPVDIHGIGPGFPLRGTFMVIDDDITNSTIRLAGKNLPSIGVGDLITLHTPKSLLDIPYYDIATDSGNYLGIKRS